MAEPKDQSWFAKKREAAKRNAKYFGAGLIGAGIGLLAGVGIPIAARKIRNRNMPEEVSE